MSLVKIIKRIQSCITIEPICFLYYLSTGLERPTTNGLWYQKVCMIMYNDEWTCENINTNETLEDWEDELQKVNSKWNFYDDICKSAPAMLLTFFIYGSISDQISRKLPIALPLIGNILIFIIRIFAAAYIRSSGGFMLLASLIEGLSGGVSTLYMAVMSYLSDVSSVKSRTFRISIAYGVGNVGWVIASSLSGIVFENTGYTTVYLISISLNVIAIIYLIFGFPDVRHNQDETDEVDKKAMKKIEESGKSETLIKESGKSETQSEECGKLETQIEVEMKEKSAVQFCNFEKRMKEPILVLLKKRKSNNRAHILALLGVFTLNILSSADFELGYLYLKGPPISLSQTEYGFYTAYGNLLKVLCMLVVIPILTMKFHVPVSILFPIAMFSTICDMMVMAFSVEKWMAYLAPTVGFFQAGFYTFGRSMLSTMVEVNETGKIFSVLSLIQDTMAMVTSAIYSYFLYPATVDIFAGFCYIFGSTVLLIPCGIAIWLHIDITKQNKSSLSPNGELNENKTDEGPEETAPLN